MPSNNHDRQISTRRYAIAAAVLGTCLAAVLTGCATGSGEQPSAQQSPVTSTTTNTATASPSPSKKTSPSPTPEVVPGYRVVRFRTPLTVPFPSGTCHYTYVNARTLATDATDDYDFLLSFCNGELKYVVDRHAGAAESPDRAPTLSKCLTAMQGTNASTNVESLVGKNQLVAFCLRTTAEVTPTTVVIVETTAVNEVAGDVSASSVKVLVSTYEATS
jgi:hypothetical protein